MKIITIMGSPREKGNTALVLSKFEELAGEKHELERINIAEHEVKGCVGCLKCQEKRDEPGCVQKDDVPHLLQKIMQSDAVVYASPLYCWSFSGQLKQFIDRHFCLMKFNPAPQMPDSLLEGKQTALLVSCGGPIEENADFIQGTFDRFANFTSLQTVGKYILPFCMMTDSLEGRAEEVAHKMSEDFC
jgi:multimeric flavodoxin WrbA